MNTNPCQVYNRLLNACGQYLWGYSDGQSVLLKAGFKKVMEVK